MTRMIVSDPEIMGGTPVFRVTRVPVYLMTDMMEQGTPVEEILNGLSVFILIVDLERLP